MLEFHPSRSGPITAFWNGKALHSEYDPVREAERFAATLSLTDTSLAIILDPGVGYLLEALRQRFPRLRTVVCFLHPEFYRMNLGKGPCWHPELGIEVERFLSRHISDEDIEGITVVEWPPLVRAFPEKARQVSEKILQFIRERQGSLLTGQFFGKRWIRNSLRNFLFLDTYIQLNPVQKPIIIAASGSSLDSSLEALAALRDRYMLWVLPSALEALFSRNLYPDLVVLTDAGYYSSVHLEPLLRFRANEREIGCCSIAMPLSAVSGVHRTGLPVQLLDQDVFYEKAFLQEGSLSAIPCPSNGTVAGSALELASRLSVSPVVFAGLDLCTNDLRTHVRPHAFETYDRDRATRLDPHHGRVFRNVVLSYPEKNGKTAERFSHPLRTYAGWFSAAKRANGNIYRLNPTGIPVPSFQPLKITDLGGLLQDFRGSSRGPACMEPPVFEERKVIALGILENWIRAIDNSMVRPGCTGADDCPYLRELIRLTGFRAGRGPGEQHPGGDTGNECGRAALEFLESQKQSVLDLSSNADMYGT